MQAKKTIGTLVISSLLLTTVSLAQDATQPQNGGPGRPPRGEMREQRQEIRKEFRESRNEIGEEFRQDRQGAIGQWQEDMKNKREWKNASTTGMATPTPWKNLRENMKDAREEAKGEMKDLKEKMRGMLPPKNIPDTALSAIAIKLGISTSTLQAQIASGTPLRQIVKDKISPEEMKSILPPKVATFTKRVEERGFFNNLRSSFFGPKEEMVKEVRNEFGEVVSTSTEPVAPRGFFRRFFGF